MLVLHIRVLQHEWKYECVPFVWMVRNRQPDSFVHLGARNECIGMEKGKRLTILTLDVPFEFCSSDRKGREQPNDHDSCTSLR